MIVAAPKDEDELRHMLYSAVRYGSPVALRYPRGVCIGADMTGPMKFIPPGQAEVLKEGKDAVILALGTMLHPSLDAAASLEKAGINASVVNCRFAKPLDADCILRAASSADCIVTVEENALQGGFGAAVMELLEEHGIQIPLKRIGVPDEFIEHGGQDELRARVGLNASGIEAAVKSLAARNKKIKLAFQP
jgi:1-deoxy-D-xylulose-5-phosphate synthase